MYIGLIITLLCAGAALAWWAVCRPASVMLFERAGGVLFIAGFALLGFALPMAHSLVQN